MPLKLKKFGSLSNNNSNNNNSNNNSNNNNIDNDNNFVVVKIRGSSLQITTEMHRVRPTAVHRAVMSFAPCKI